MTEKTLLEAKGVNVVYEPARGINIMAVRDVDLNLRAGEFVGLVGESGCGKSTLGFALTRMLRPPARLSSGQILFDGQDISQLDGEDLRRQRRGGFALVLQSGMNALNPVRSIAKHFGDILKAHTREGEKWTKASIRERGAELLAKVQLDPDVLDRFPHELSGGMRQRVSIALALALEPKLIVFDEPTTALDVIVQKAVMATIKDLQRDEGFTAILISHDLGIVLEATDRVMVMYAGEIVEDQPSSELLRGPHHPYTEALLRCYADPRADEIELGGIPGAPPDLSQEVAGCPFTPRCPLAEDICHQQDPPLVARDAGLIACHVRAPAPGTPRDEAPPAEAPPVTSPRVADVPAARAEAPVATAPTVPAGTVPVEAAPAAADPVKADPVKADPVKADPVKAAPAAADPTEAAPVAAAPANEEAAGTATVPTQKTTEPVPAPTSTEEADHAG
jgi:oligopeptide/dipeptide ABC transporter ATP-binding protein